ncbi:unnamed protein product, partial [Ixodes persulcatus]
IKGGLTNDFLEEPSARHSHLKGGLKRHQNGPGSLEGAGSAQEAWPSRETSIGQGKTSAIDAYSDVASDQKRRRHRAGLNRKFVQRHYARKHSKSVRKPHRSKAIQETGLKGRAAPQTDIGNILSSVPESQKELVPAQQTNLIGKSAPNQEVKGESLSVPETLKAVEPVQQTNMKRSDISEGPSSKSESPLKLQRSAPAIETGLKRNPTSVQDSKSKPLRAQKAIQQTGLKKKAFKQGLGSKTVSAHKGQQNAAPPLPRGLEGNYVASQDSESRAPPALKTLQSATNFQRTGLKKNALKKSFINKAIPVGNVQQKAAPALQRGLEDWQGKSVPVLEASQKAASAQEPGLNRAVLKTLGRKTVFVPKGQQGVVPPLQGGLKGSVMPRQSLNSKLPTSNSFIDGKSARQARLKATLSNKSFDKKTVAPREMHQEVAEALQRGAKSNPAPSQDQYAKSILVPKPVTGVKRQVGRKEAPAQGLNSKLVSAPRQRIAPSDLKAQRKTKSYPNKVSGKYPLISNAQQSVQPVQQVGMKERSAPNQTFNRKSAPLPQAQGSINRDQKAGSKGRAAPNQEPGRSVSVPEQQQQGVEPIQETNVKRDSALKHVLATTASAVKVRGAKQAKQLGQFPTYISNHQATTGSSSVPYRAVKAQQMGNSIQQETPSWQGKTARQAGLQISPVGEYPKALVHESVQKQQAAPSYINRNAKKLQNSQYETSRSVPSNELQRSGNNENPGLDIAAQQTQGHNEKLVLLQNKKTIFHGKAYTTELTEQQPKHHLQRQLQVPDGFTTSVLQGQQQAHSGKAVSALYQEDPHPHLQQQLSQHQVHSRQAASTLLQEHRYPQQQVHTQQDFTALHQEQSHPQLQQHAQH